MYQKGVSYCIDCLLSVNLPKTSVMILILALFTWNNDWFVLINKIYCFYTYPNLLGSCSLHSVQIWKDPKVVILQISKTQHLDIYDIVYVWCIWSLLCYIFSLSLLTSLDLSWTYKEHVKWFNKLFSDTCVKFAILMLWDKDFFTEMQQSKWFWCLILL